MAGTYRIQTFYTGEWVTLKTESLGYCHGYLDARKDNSPRFSAYRIVKPDGTVVRELPAQEELRIGMVAGLPTAEQYEAAAKKAMEIAKAIRERKQ